jgi:hypothetical protein
MTSKQEWFSSFNENENGNEIIVYGYGKKLPIHGYGEIPMQLTNGEVESIQNVLYVPDLQHSLILVSGTHD